MVEDGGKQTFDILEAALAQYPGICAFRPHFRPHSRAHLRPHPVVHPHSLPHSQI